MYTLYQHPKNYYEQYTLPRFSYDEWHTFAKWHSVALAMEPSSKETKLRILRYGRAQYCVDSFATAEFAMKVYAGYVNYLTNRYICGNVNF